MDESDLAGLPEINAQHIRIVQEGNHELLVVNGRPYMRWASGDESARRIAMVQICELGLGSQEHIARAFGTSERSVYNYVHTFAAQGTHGLLNKKKGPKGSWKISPAVRSKILYIFLKEGITEYELIRDRLQRQWGEHVGITSVRRVLLENGLVIERTVFPDTADQRGLFQVQEQEQLEFGFDRQARSEQKNVEPKIRKKGVAETVESRTDSVFGEVETRARRYYSRSQRAYFDELERGSYSAYAGALLFSPLLMRYPFMPTIDGVVDIPTHEGCTLGQLCWTLFYFDVFGFHSMEDFKTVYPEEFGVLVGRPCSPSHFTLRRFLHGVRKLNKSEELMEAFARMYLDRGIAKWGVLYIDAHFLPYYGMYPVTKGWHGVRKVPMKGSYSFLGIDENFAPWIFFVRSSSEDLLRKIPEMIERAKQIARQVGLDQQQVDDLVVIFDREGYSAELYGFLDGRDRDDGVRRAILISWAKYADQWVHDIPESRFDKSTTVTYEIQDPEEIRYFETERTMSKYGKIRAIVVEKGTGSSRKRMAIYTNGSEEEISSERVVQLICRRWGQENFIKELLLKHFINYSPGYVKEWLEEQPMVDNPEVKELKKKKAGLVSMLNKLKVQLADKLLKDAEQDGSWEVIKSSEILLRADIARIDNDILLLSHERDGLPAKVPFDQAHKGKRLLKFNYEKKRFLDCIKIYTYNMEKKMCRLLLNHYGKEKEILPALSMIVRRGGHMKLEHGTLEVVLRRFKNRQIDYAARHLCEDINTMHPVTLDSYHLPIRFSVT